jgi:hypothetical protein
VCPRGKGEVGRDSISCRRQETLWEALPSRQKTQIRWWAGNSHISGDICPMTSILYKLRCRILCHNPKWHFPTRLYRDIVQPRGNAERDKNIISPSKLSSLLRLSSLRPDNYQCLGATQSSLAIREHCRWFFVALYILALVLFIVIKCVGSLLRSGSNSSHRTSTCFASE